jgi:hypothetical protein
MHVGGRDDVAARLGDHHRMTAEDLDRVGVG